jgi:hypothetical protein
MSRPKEPEYLVQWREWMRAGPPKCCHTCEHYSPDGECWQYKMTPPQAFADSVGECKDWIPEIPF